MSYQSVDHWAFLFFTKPLQSFGLSFGRRIEVPVNFEIANKYFTANVILSACDCTENEDIVANIGTEACILVFTDVSLLCCVVLLCCHWNQLINNTFFDFTEFISYIKELSSSIA